MSIEKSKRTQWNLGSHARRFALSLSMLMSPFAMAEGSLTTAIANSGTDIEATQSVQESDKVNLNTADANQLADKLKGIGLAKAEAIIAYRTEFGPFVEPSDLTKVKGIGERTVAEIIDQLSF